MTPTAEKNQGILDGKSITYQYKDLGTVRVDFDGGLVSFEWIEGPYKGASGHNLTYQAKKVGATIFLNWLEKNDSTFVTLLIDPDNNKVHSSAIISPKSENEMILFHEAEILNHNLN